MSESPDAPQAPEPPASTFPVSEEPPSGLVMMGLASPLPAPGTVAQPTPAIQTNVPFISGSVSISGPETPTSSPSGDILAIVNQNHAEVMAMLSRIWDYIDSQR